MTIWHIQLFIAVAETGSMSAAAQQYGIRQPSVSQKISELENYYGVRLFERMGNRLQITQTGKQFLPLAKDAVSKFDAVEEFLHEEHKASRLRIGATITVGSSVFPQIMQTFRQQQPDCQVFACIDNTAAICRRLLENELDIGLVEGKVTSSDLVCLPQIHDFLVLACGRNHPFYHKPVLYSDELNEMEFVMREAGSGTRALFEQYLTAHDLHIRTVFEYNNPDAMRGAVLYNQCLAVLSARLLEKEAKQGDVCMFQTQPEEWRRSFSLVYHKNKHISRSMRCFIQVLAQFQDIIPTVRNTTRPLRSR